MADDKKTSNGQFKQAAAPAAPAVSKAELTGYVKQYDTFKAEILKHWPKADRQMGPLDAHDPKNVWTGMWNLAQITAERARNSKNDILKFELPNSIVKAANELGAKTGELMLKVDYSVKNPENIVHMVEPTTITIKGPTPANPVVK